MPCKNQIKPIVFDVTDRQISDSTYKSSIAYKFPIEIEVAYTTMARWEE